jgi:ribokinase
VTEPTKLPPIKLPLIVGSLHYDIIVETDHLPRLDETAVGKRWFPKFGGKGGNQAVAAVPARMVGAIGDDDFGAFLRRRLAESGVDHKFVACLPGGQSGMSVATMDAKGDYAATIVSGTNLMIDPALIDDPAIWNGIGILVLQNEIPETVNLAAAQAARVRQIPVLLNAAPARALAPEFAALVDILLVNAVEAEMFGTKLVNDLPSAEAAATQLARSFPTVIVTAGAKGLACVTIGQRAISFPAIKVKAVSSHGAGDCFTGALAKALTARHSLVEACQMAASAAAAHVAALR